MSDGEPKIERHVKRITATIPERHAELLAVLAKETGVTRGQIVAQAIAMLHSVHIGAWRIENNQLETMQEAKAKGAGA